MATGARAISATFNRDATAMLTLSPSAGGKIRADGPFGTRSCSAQCTVETTVGSSVGVGAEPDPGYVVDQFIGCPGGSASCYLTMGGATNIVASFRYVGFKTLTISPVPEHGWVLAYPDIRCGETGTQRVTACTMRATTGSQVTVNATASAGFVFRGFTGACGPWSCRITMNDDATVQVLFGPP
jgi:hypothetical protein